MVTYENSLVIDLGEVGWREKARFRVRLDAKPLVDLVRHAAQAYRVYELFLLRRPGDVWPYVWVELLDVPPRVAARYESARRDTQPGEGSEHAWPAGMMPLAAFNALFHWAGDDTEPEDEAWLNQTKMPAMREFADTLLGQIRLAQSQLGWSAPLIEHEISRIHAGKHPYDYREAPRLAPAWATPGPGPAHFTEDFYKQLKKIVAMPEVLSVSCRFLDDYRLYCILCTEQIRRAKKYDLPPGRAMVISALADFVVDTEPWGAKVWFYSEGLGYGDLHIEGGARPGNSLKALYQSGHRRLGPYVLAAADQGDLEGYEKEIGDGWVRYSALEKADPRKSIALINRYLYPPVRKVFELEYNNQVIGVYDYERVVVLVGAMPDVGQEQMAAQWFAELDRVAEHLTIVVTGDSTAFERAGCKRVLHVPALIAGDEHGKTWHDVQRLMKRVDVLVQLNTEEAIEQEFGKLVSTEERRGNCFVVSIGRQGSVSGDSAARYPEGFEQFAAACRLNT